jgi:hypothetical protein
MITVELQQVPEGEQDYQTVATLSVAADGGYQLDDPGDLFPTSLHVVVPDVGGLRQVRFEEDPQTWARNLGNLLRGGYLVPVVTRDDETDALPPAGAGAEIESS